MKKKTAKNRSHTTAAKKRRNKRAATVSPNQSRSTLETVAANDIAAAKASDFSSENTVSDTSIVDGNIVDNALDNGVITDNAIVDNTIADDVIADNPTANNPTTTCMAEKAVSNEAAHNKTANNEATDSDAANSGDIIEDNNTNETDGSDTDSTEKEQKSPDEDRQSRHPVLNIWRKRIKFPYALYFFVFIITTVVTTLILQWSVFEEPDPELASSDSTTAILQSVPGQLTKFVTRIWLENNKTFLLNAIIIALLYLAALFLLNRFWFTTALLLAASIVYAIANKFKVSLRDEPISPADFTFITGGNTTELLSFVPEDGQSLVQTGVTCIAAIVGIGILLQILDGRRQFVVGRISRLKTSMKHRVGFVVRIIAFITSVATLSTFCWNLSIQDTRAHDFAYSWQDRPVMSSSIADAQNNGAVLSFARFIHTDIMETPDNYSQETMNRIAKKYARVANEINAERSNNLTDSTVIMILSESFSDPLRVPGLTFEQDPIPFIRQFKETTTSGLMLSSGYGGGTANMEYQALTGLSMSNYSLSLSSAYQQLVPKQSWTPTFNQLWNAEDGTGDSVTLHSFFRNMYSRDTVYKKFGFSAFKTIDPDDGSNRLENRNLLPGAIYLSDEASYGNVLSELKNNPDENQFIHLVTMQNHMPYYDWEEGNVYSADDVQGDISESERKEISYYVNGLTYTDNYTRDFLDQLNQLDQPITVIWYGDHLPSVYSTANADENNALTMHETDYFIWSNSVSSSSSVKLDSSETGVVSPNYFMPLAAKHMNAKVTPFLALLTEMHDAIPAMAPAASGGTTSQSPVYIDAEGNRIPANKLSKEAKELLNDYKLVQYDLSAGKSYLKDTAFTTFQ